VTTLTTRVWQRHGQLRIYVSAGALNVGWYDPRSGRFQLGHPAMEAAFWTEIRAEIQRLLRDGRLDNAALRQEPGPVKPRQPAPQEPAPPAPPPAAPEDNHWVVRAPEWDDLARTAPGASARAHARELRRDHPLLTTAAGILGIRTQARSFAMGAAGEQAVGRKLNRWAADQGWHVLHAVPVGVRGADIDHVVIAPFGVVTVNTKATRSAVWVGEYGMRVGGTTVDYLRKSRAEGRRAHRLLSRAAGLDVPVQPAIVFVGPQRFARRRGGPADIAVLPSPRALRRWLRRQPRALDPGQVQAVYEAARRPATWQGRQPRTR
jgi:Nuclease-related domain